MNVQDMLKRRIELLNYADAIQGAAKSANRATTSGEESIIASSMEQIDALDKQISERRSQTTLNGRDVLLGSTGERVSGLASRGSAPLIGNNRPSEPRATYSADYLNDFHSWISSGG